MKDLHKKTMKVVKKVRAETDEEQQANLILKFCKKHIYKFPIETMYDYKGETIEAIVSDMEYCSDRWNFGRLYTCYLNAYKVWLKAYEAKIPSINKEDDNE